MIEKSYHESNGKDNKENISPEVNQIKKKLRSHKKQGRPIKNYDQLSSED